MNINERKTDRKEGMKTSSLMAVSVAVCMVLFCMMGCPFDDDEPDDDGNGGNGKDFAIPEKATVKMTVKQFATGQEYTMIQSHDSYAERMRIDFYMNQSGVNMHTIILYDYTAKTYWFYNSFNWSQQIYPESLRVMNGLKYEKGMDLDEYYKKVGLVKQGKMTVLGKECNVYVGKILDEARGVYDNHKYGMWNGIALYHENDAEGGFSETATAYTFDCPAKAFDRATIEVDWIK